MNRLLFGLLAATAATPALAQNSGHPAQTASLAQASSCTPEHAAMGHCTMPPSPLPTCTAEHAAMGHCTMSASETARSHQVPAAPPAMSSCTPEHAAMGHCSMPYAQPATPAAASPPRTPTAACSPEHAAMGHCVMPSGQVMEPPAPTPGPACTPEHAAMGHCTMPASPPATASQPCTPEHAAMGHCTPADPHAGHQMPAGAASSDPHAGHTMPSSAAADVPVGPPPPEALAGPAHAQDLIFDPADAARSRAQMMREHGGLSTSKFLIDQAEVKFGEGGEEYALDAQFWYGGDINKLWLKSELEGAFGEALEHGEVQALYGRAIDPWFDLQTGIRQDFGTGSNRTHLVLGIQGLAPYWFEVEGTLFLSTKGELTGRVEAEYDLRLTQQLILQPNVELGFSFQNMPDIGVGAGISAASLGARLRHEFFPERGLAVIAPYLGLEYEQAFGKTADYRRAAGEKSGAVRFVTGLRLWF
jgi:copper resistance protein B